MAATTASLAGSMPEESLRSEIEALRLQLAQKEAQLRALSAEKPQASALALPSQAPSQQMAPGSSLVWGKALRAASAARYMVSGASLMTVEATGSMKPLFDEKAVLIMEPAPFEALQVGDIITYIHPDHAQPVVHRILCREGDGFRTQGDNNNRADEVLITRANYQARVFGIIYANESPKS